MPSLECVYWDLDGTIANTELEAHLPAFNNAFNDLGIDWNWDTNTYIKLLKINGGKNRIAYYAKSNNDNFSEDLILKIHETKQFHYLEIIKKNCVSLKTGVFRLINELHRKKVRQFIVTSSSRIQVNLLVKYLFNGFNPFEFIISSEDVELKKPNPLPYLKAIQFLPPFIFRSFMYVLVSQFQSMPRSLKALLKAGKWASNSVFAMAPSKSQ